MPDSRRSGSGRVWLAASGRNAYRPAVFGRYQTPAGALALLGPIPSCAAAERGARGTSCQSTLIIEATTLAFCIARAAMVRRHPSEASASAKAQSVQGDRVRRDTGRGNGRGQADGRSAAEDLDADFPSYATQAPA